MVEAKENERVLKESLADLKEYRKKKIASKSKEKDNSKIKEIETKIAALDIEINRLEKTLEEVSKNTMILASTEYE
jgi:esterase/lipase